MSIATAFQTIHHKALAIETRLKTLDLYKCLMNVTKHYPHTQILKKEIRDQFKNNQYMTSRPKVLEQLLRAEKTLEVLERGVNEQQLNSKILTFIKSYCVPKWEKKSMVYPEKKKKKKFVKRKPYQVAITVTTAFGITFKRVRGWRQPVQTSMMLKNRVKKKQERLDRMNELYEQLNMIRAEKMFLRNLRCLEKDELLDYETNIKEAMSSNKRYKI